MQYEEVPGFENNDLGNLESNNPQIVIMALLSVVMHSENYEAAISTTRRFLLHPDEYIRGAAMECISHIARLWKKLPDDLLVAANNSLYDRSEWVQGKGEFVIDDLEVFISGYKRL